MTKLDEMLSQWPMRDATQLEADEAAERVTGAITSGQLPASVDETLLAPPLPKTPDEGQTSAPRISKPGFFAPGAAVENKMSTTKDRTRDRTSFQELAKLATTPPPTSSVPVAPTSTTPSSGVLRAKEAESSDSGIVDLKMIAALDPTAAQRAQSTPLASDGLFDDDAAPAKPASSAAPVVEKVAAAPASSASEAAPAVAQPVASAVAAVSPKKAAPAEKKGGGGVVLAIGALVAAAAIAAGGFFFIKYQRASRAVAQQTTTVQTAAATTPTAPTATATASGAVAQNDTQAPDTTQEIVADPANGKPILKFHAKPSTGGGAATTAAQQDPAPPAGTVDPKLVANIPTGGAGGSSGDLSEAMKTAAGGGMGLGQGGSNDQGPKVAGNVPQHPSQGQVAGAVGSVMPAAKACMNADDPMSRATVTFQSDGTVKSVSVSGFAAGKPQEACIKAALSKATVSPFAEATYPVPVTIRSN